MNDFIKKIRGYIFVDMDMNQEYTGYRIGGMKIWIKNTLDIELVVWI